jgi:large subunit ribosomal protein L23
VKTPRDVIIRPVVSEKSYAGLEQNTYTFLVDPRATKTEIKEAVQVIWNVQVVSVRTLNRTGKVKRRRYTLGKRADQKRAIVKLAEGDAAPACPPSRRSRAPSPSARSSRRGATARAGTRRAG